MESIFIPYGTDFRIAPSDNNNGLVITLPASLLKHVPLFKPAPNLSENNDRTLTIKFIGGAPVSLDEIFTFLRAYGRIETIKQIKKNEVKVTYEEGTDMEDILNDLPTRQFERNFVYIS